MREALAVLCALAFLGYGVHCLGSMAMEKEFDRYGLKKFRHLTGALEVLGAIGLLVGLKYSILMSLASAGLCLLMFLGVLVRLRIKDSFFAFLPALILMGVTLAIVLL
jgi:hypothetical protein